MVVSIIIGQTIVLISVVNSDIFYFRTYSKLSAQSASQYSGGTKTVRYFYLFKQYFKSFFFFYYKELIMYFLF